MSCMMPCPTGQCFNTSSCGALGGRERYLQPTPEGASWGGYVPCSFRVPYPVLFGDASKRVSWRVNAQRPPYGSIYDSSTDPDRVGVGYPAYSIMGHN